MSKRDLKAALKHFETAASEVKQAFSLLEDAAAAIETDQVFLDALAKFREASRILMAAANEVKKGVDDL